MNLDIESQVRRIHASPTKATVITTGGGVAVLHWLLATSGASRTILEAIVPYSRGSLSEFLGYNPRQIVAFRTAQDMARTAYQKAVQLHETKSTVVGIASTASVTTDLPKQGSHRCHVSSWTATRSTTYSLRFVKGLRNREEEDNVVSRLLLRALAEASCVEFDLPLDLHESEHVEISTKIHTELIDQLIKGEADSVTIHPDRTIVADEAVEGAIIAGSFDPLHKGHKKLAQVASEILGQDVIFELAIVNVDKPRLEKPQIIDRVAQFADKASVVVTQASTYLEKAKLFPNCTFVIGWDTATRVVDSNYYENNDKKMLDTLQQILDLGCRFLVAGRISDGIFRTLDQIEIPTGFEIMFKSIPEKTFRCDVSSSSLRL